MTLWASSQSSDCYTQTLLHFFGIPVLVPRIWQIRRRNFKNMWFLMCAHPIVRDFYVMSDDSSECRTWLSRIKGKLEVCVFKSIQYTMRRFVTWQVLSYKRQVQYQSFSMSGKYFQKDVITSWKNQYMRDSTISWRNIQIIVSFFLPFSCQ